MLTVTATEMARRLREILDRVEFRGESVTVVRNKRAVARIMPGAQEMTAREAFAGLQGIVGEDAARGWHADRRSSHTIDSELRDPWPAATDLPNSPA